MHFTDGVYDSFETFAQVEAAFLAGREIQVVVNPHMCTPVEGTLPELFVSPNTSCLLWAFIDPLLFCPVSLFASVGLSAVIAGRPLRKRCLGLALNPLQNYRISSTSWKRGKQVKVIRHGQ